MTIRTRVVHPDVPGPVTIEIPEKHRGSRIRMQGLTLSAELLDGATLYLAGATPYRDERYAPSIVRPIPTGK